MQRGGRACEGRFLKLPLSPERDSGVWTNAHRTHGHIAQKAVIAIFTIVFNLCPRIQRAIGLVFAAKLPGPEIFWPEVEVLPALRAAGVAGGPGEGCQQVGVLVSTDHTMCPNDFGLDVLLTEITFLPTKNLTHRQNFVKQ